MSFERFQQSFEHILCKLKNYGAFMPLFSHLFFSKTAKITNAAMIAYYSRRRNVAYNKYARNQRRR